MAPQSAVITGGSSGIGAAFARRLASEGFDLLLIARRRDRLEAIAMELAQAHLVKVRILPADLATEAGLKTAEEAVSNLADLAMLVNNAGFGVAGRFFETSVDDHDRMHRLHVTATLRLTHAALRRMVPEDRGAVVNVSSVAGFIATPGSVTYSATKHWMNSFTEGLWLELQSQRSGVRVQALCPGFTLSEFHDVMPMDRSKIPSAWWTDSREVVEASLSGLGRNQLFVIPGWRYRTVVTFAQLVPPPIIRGLGVVFARGLQRLK